MPCPALHCTALVCEKGADRLWPGWMGLSAPAGCGDQTSTQKQEKTDLADLTEQWGLLRYSMAIPWLEGSPPAAQSCPTPMVFTRSVIRNSPIWTILVDATTSQANAQGGKGKGINNLILVLSLTQPSVLFPALSVPQQLAS